MVPKFTKKLPLLTIETLLMTVPLNIFPFQHVTQLVFNEINDFRVGTKLVQKVAATTIYN